MKTTHLFATCLLLIGCQSEIDNKTAADVAPATPSAEQAKPATPAVAAAAVPAGSLTLQPGSSIEWVGAKVTSDHTGGFKALSGHAVVADGTVKNATVTIDVSSIYSDHPKLTTHLLSDDFFDVSKFTTTTFEITEVATAEGGPSTVTGTLDLHGIQKTISFPATVKTTDSSATISAEFTLLRKDFGMTYPGKSDNLIRDEVLVKGTLSFGS
jgi:polyisoprenoid-binding protein YceI